MRLTACLIVLLTASLSIADEPAKLPRCEIIPQADHQVSFQIDGVEKLRWHFGPKYPRPFFFPFNGPSGVSLTRMGHPGAENHDHHRSVWFAFAKLNGIDFWSDKTKALVRQKHWYAYRDGDDEAVMSSKLGWYDAENREVMEQDVVAAIRPMDDGEMALEIQTTLRPPKNVELVELNQTNFGVLAVRVAKSLSEHFGGGQLTNSDLKKGEPEIFGKQAKWMDYSGTVRVGKGAGSKSTTEGITFFDHPSNLRSPCHWHVREDGWMGASLCMKKGHSLTPTKTLTLRYLLHAHAGAYDHKRAALVFQAFSKRPGFVVQPSKRKHRQYEVFRKQPNDD